MGRKPSSGGGFELPRRLGDYELTRRLGGGTLGERFEARRVRDDLPCVIRVFPPGFAARLPKVLQEAKAAAGLHHRHVRALYDMGREGDVFWVAMEPCDAWTLEEWLASPERVLDPGQGIEALAQVARALQAAHESGVVHGHLRPEVVYVQVTDEGVLAKVENFGFEKLRTVSMLVASGSVDRARCLAPEQAIETEHADARSDVYAIGVMLYRLVCGRYHVEGQTTHEILRHVADGDVTPPRQADPGIDPDVEAVIQRCLALDPNGRYASARALSADLERLSRGERPLARDVKPSTTRYRPAAGRKLPWVAGGAAVVLAGAIGTWAATRGGSPPAAPEVPRAAARSTVGNAAAQVPTPSPPRPPADPGPAVRARAQAMLDAGDASHAVSLLSPHLADHPDDGAALALRGAANVARGEPALALADLDRAQSLLGMEADAAADARARACWALAQAAFEAGRFDDDVHAELSLALARAHALPRPVDPVRFLEAWCRQGRARVAGWPALADARLPAGPLREYLRVSERLSEDPTPPDEADVYAAAMAQWPGWADPVAHEAVRRRLAGDAAGARTLLARAVEADPDHPAVTLARCCVEVLDGRPGAVARAIEAWKRVRGADPHTERMFFFKVRDRLRAAGARLAAVHVMLAYLAVADERALVPVLQFFLAGVTQGLADDLRAFADGPCPDGPAAALHAAVRALLDPAGDAAAARAAAARALDDDPLGAHAAVLGALSLGDRDTTGALASLVDRLGPGRQPFQRLADAALAVAHAAGERDDLQTTQTWVERALALCADPPRWQRAMAVYGGSAIRHGARAHGEWFLSLLRPQTTAADVHVRLAAWLWTARTHERLEAWDAAHAAYSSAMEAVPDDPAPLAWRACFALRRGEGDRAQMDCDTLVALHPDDPVGYFVRGVRAHLAGDHARAAEDYAAALARGGGAAAGVCEALAGLVAWRQADTARATEHLDRVARGRGDGARLAFLVRGWARAEAGDRPGAIEDLADAAMLPASDWERALPVASLHAEATGGAATLARAIADLLLARTEQAFQAKEWPVAAAALSACAAQPERDDGRLQYGVARLHAARGEAGADSALEALARAAASGYRPGGPFGGEAEFAALRATRRFEEIVRGVPR